MNYWQTTVLILVALPALPASIALAEDFKTVNGKEYEDVTVSRVEADGIVLKTKTGISKVYFVELPKEVQERFHYKPATVAPQSSEQNPNLTAASKHKGASDKNPVKTEVATTATGLLVTNLDEFTWPSVTVYINGDPMTGYEFVYNRAISPRETIPLRFFEFTRGDKRFNPIERKVKQVIVHVPGHDAPMFGFE